MNKELQNSAWSVLPKEFKKQVKEDYKFYLLNREYVKEQILECLFGEHNLDLDELNLCEILKEYKGIPLYSPCYGQVELTEVRKDKFVIQDTIAKRHTVNSDGTHYPAKGSCIVFPNIDLYKEYPLDPKKAWEEWVGKSKKGIEQENPFIKISETAQYSIVK